MPAYNFQPRFAPFVGSGEKPCTIRLPRKRPTVPGDRLYLYTGQRTKACRLLRVETCLAVVLLYIFLGRDKALSHCILYKDTDRFRILYRWDMDDLAKLDTGGLLTWGEVVSFLETNYGLPFTGELIQFLPHPWLDQLTVLLAARVE